MGLGKKGKQMVKRRWEENSNRVRGNGARGSVRERRRRNVRGDRRGRRGRREAAGVGWGKSWDLWKVYGDSGGGEGGRVKGKRKGVVRRGVEGEGRQGGFWERGW